MLQRTHTVWKDPVIILTSERCACNYRTLVLVDIWSARCGEMSIGYFFRRLKILSLLAVSFGSVDFAVDSR